MLVSVRPRADRRVTFGTKRNRNTYNIANLRGFRDNTGSKAKHMTKQTRAAALQAPKTSRRSHLLTVARVDRQPGVLMSSNADETGKCIEGMQLKDSACDDNGRAGASVKSSSAYGGKMKDMKRILLTCKPPFLFLSSTGSRQWGAGALLCR